MIRVSEPADLYAAFIYLGAMMEKFTRELSANTVKVLDSPGLQDRVRALAAQLEPLMPLIERMSLPREHRENPYICHRHAARLPAGCLCPLCLDDGAYNAGLCGKEHYQS